MCIHQGVGGDGGVPAWGKVFVKRPIDVIQEFFASSFFFVSWKEEKASSRAAAVKPEDYYMVLLKALSCFLALIRKWPVVSISSATVWKLGRRRSNSITTAEYYYLSSGFPDSERAAWCEFIGCILVGILLRSWLFPIVTMDWQDAHWKRINSQAGANFKRGSGSSSERSNEEKFSDARITVAAASCFCFWY